MRYFQILRVLTRKLACAVRPVAGIAGAALVTASTLSAPSAAANPLDDLTTNARWSLDFATVRSEQIGGDGWSGRHAVGFDYRTVLGGPGGDAAVIVFQPYLLRLVNARQPNLTVEDPDEWELTWRIANVNLKVLDRGRLNIRIGHFEVPYGIEQNLDTNGTLRQFTFADQGIKVDWGVTANGTIAGFEYETAYSLGAGNDVEQRDGSGLVTGRIGTSSQRNLVAGFSFMEGHILTASGSTERRRIGIDLAWYRNNWETLAEISVGENDDRSIANTLVDIGWRTPLEDWLVYTQWRTSRLNADSGSERRQQYTLGVRWQRTRRFLVSAEARRDAPSGAADVDTLTVQARYRTGG